MWRSWCSMTPGRGTRRERTARDPPGAATRYRPPQLVVDIATATGPSVVRERHGVYFDYHQPLTEHPEAPLGKDFADQKNLPFWWSLAPSACGPWPRSGAKTGNKYRLWETEGFTEVNLLAAINDYDPDKIRTWIYAPFAVINFGFLAEANTYAYREDKVSLATVRPTRGRPPSTRTRRSSPTTR